MKTLGKVGLFMIMAINTCSAFFLNGTDYINCDTCYFEYQFRDAAKSFSATNSHSSKVVVVNLTQASAFNQPIGSLWTYKVDKNASNEENSIQFQSPSQENIGPATNIISPLLSAPSRIKTAGELSTSTQDLNLISVTRIPNSTSDVDLFGAYLNEIQHYVYPQLIGYISLDLPETRWEFSGDIRVTRDAEFLDKYKALINQAINQTDYNPFYFMYKPLTVKVTTGNRYVVTLQNTEQLGTPEWTHLLTRHQEYRNRMEPLYDTVAYKSLVFTSSGLSPVSFKNESPNAVKVPLETFEYCEPLDSDTLDQPILICRLAEEPFNVRLVPPGQYHNPCEPLEFDCNDSSGGFFNSLF